MLNKVLSIVFMGIVSLSAATSISYEESCRENNATACYMHALPMITGDNAKVQDIKEKGMSYIRKGCLLGEDKACDVMGDNYYKDANYRTAIPYLEKSCARGVQFACVSLGTIYRDGHDVRPDDVKSREYYEKACDLKSGDACYSVAIIYRGGFGVAKNRAQEKVYYKKACDVGVKAGCSRFTELDNEDKGIETGIFATIKSWFK